ncbi:MAG: hypothetical protein M3P31_02860, partial [Actinomycetota bacterium]|nr:hypothetical protein [Actinomycetota bacterium]
MTTAVLLATTEAGAGRLAAALAVAGTTPVVRLTSQLAPRVDDVRLLTRPTLAPSAPVDFPLLTGDLCGDLDLLAEVLEAGSAPVLLVHAELVLSGALLDVVLADPRSAVTAVVGPPDDGGWPVRTAGGVVVAAGSPFHSVTGSSESLRGVVRVPAQQRSLVAKAARSAADELRGARMPVLDHAAPQDALAVLIVALARTGVRVRTVPVRGFVCARVLDGMSADRAAAHLERVDEDRARMDAAVKPDDGFTGTFLVSPYSKRLARQAARWQVRPNTVTV